MLSSARSSVISSAISSLTSKLVPFACIVLFASLSSAQDRTPASPLNAEGAPPIKMGLWEATTTTQSLTFKMRSCVTPESYKDTLTRMPPGCTLANPVINTSSISGDVSCTLPNGASGNGHFDAQFPDSSTMHGSISLNISVQGHSMQTAIKTDSHFVSASCGDIQPGETREVK